MKIVKVLAAAVLFCSVTTASVYALGFKSQSLGKPTPVNAREPKSTANGGAKNGAAAQQGGEWDTTSYGLTGMWLRVQGEDGLIPLKPCDGAENCRLSNDNGKEEMRAFGLNVQLTKHNGKQNMCFYKFTFIPRRDGKIRVLFNKVGMHRCYPPEDPVNHPEIRKPYDNPDLCWMCIGDIRIVTTGRSRFNNGNFSSGLKGWAKVPRYTTNDKRTQQGMIQVKGDIPNGRAYRTSAAISQVIEVQKDKEITISFWWAPDECFAALH